MNTPPAPSFSSKTNRVVTNPNTTNHHNTNYNAQNNRTNLLLTANKSQVTVTRPVADSLMRTTAKTPFQTGTYYQRTARSEFQPNRYNRQCFTVNNKPSVLNNHNIISNYNNYLSNNNNNNISINNAPVLSRLGSKFCQPKSSQTVREELKAVQTPNTVARSHSEPIIKYQVQINEKTYKILRKIGSGGSAKVYEGFEPKTSHTVAIKIIDLKKADDKARESYFNEQKLLERLKDSKHVVHMFDSQYREDLQELLIVMEKGDADLSQVIENHCKSRSPKMIDGIFIKFYWSGIVRAVNDIHKQGIVHADLKPVNFILVKNEIKLIDFGIANAVEPDCTSVIRDYQIGTINYMSPESLRNRALDASFQLQNNGLSTCKKKTVIKYNCKADIWSLGCILYNLVYGRPPFDQFKDIVSKVQAITNPSYEIKYPPITNEKLLNCMKKCLNYNPLDRPTTQDLLQDPYLREDLVELQRFRVESSNSTFPKSTILGAKSSM